jgi:hypothetical protein
VKWQRWNRTLLDRGESSVLTKRKIKLLNSLNFSWGYQRVPPQKKPSDSATSTPLEAVVSVEPMPFMPGAEDPIEPLPFMPVESVSSSSIKQKERQHVVSPPFSAPSLKNHMTNSIREDRVTSASIFRDTASFFGRQVNTSSLFHHNQASFARPSMSPFDNERFDRKVTQSPNPFEFQPRLQGDFAMNMNLQVNYMPNGFLPMVEDPFKINVGHMGGGRHVAVSKCWKCSVCRFASFDTYEEALNHENSCNGFPEGSFCRACAA